MGRLIFFILPHQLAKLEIPVSNPDPGDNFSLKILSITEFSFFSLHVDLEGKSYLYFSSAVHCKTLCVVFSFFFLFLIHTIGYSISEQE